MWMGTVLHWWWLIQNGQATLKDSLEVFFQNKTYFNHIIQHCIKILDIYPKDLKTYIHTKKHTQVFIAAIVINAKTWKQ